MSVSSAPPAPGHPALDDKARSGRAPLAEPTWPTTVVGRNPATGATTSCVPGARPEDVEDALRRARSALPAWSALSLAERAQVIEHFADLVSARRDSLAGSIVAEVGKPITEARAEVEWTVTSARWYAAHPPEPERAGSALVRRRPVGVVAAITPWNVPLLTPAWKWLPALVAGNTVVWKPSERASGIGAAAVALLSEAGLPPGVLVPVFGAAGAAGALASHPAVDAVHFTGSTSAGRALARAASEGPKPIALELGGLNPAIVLRDADLERAAAAIMASATAISGQKCSATRQVLVERAAADALADCLCRELRSLAPGDPRATSTRIGPLISPEAADRASRAVEAARSRGGRVVAQAPSLDPSSPLDRRSFFAPVLLDRLGPDDPLRNDELFAPVVTLVEVEDGAEAVELANRLPYGLAASVFTSNLELGRRLAEALDFGIVALNRRGDAVDLEAPFCGRRGSGNAMPEGGHFVYSSLTTPQAFYGLPGPAHSSASAHGPSNAPHGEHWQEDCRHG